MLRKIILRLNFTIKNLVFPFPFRIAHFVAAVLKLEASFCFLSPKNVLHESTLPSKQSTPAVRVEGGAETTKTRPRGHHAPF